MVYKNLKENLYLAIDNLPIVRRKQEAKVVGPKEGDIGAPSAHVLHEDQGRNGHLVPVPGPAPGGAGRRWWQRRPADVSETHLLQYQHWKQNGDDSLKYFF